MSMARIDYGRKLEAFYTGDNPFPMGNIYLKIVWFQWHGCTQKILPWKSHGNTVHVMFPMRIQRLSAIGVC